jgi:hypothetical protein
MDCCTYAKVDSNGVVTNLINLNEDEVGDLATLTQMQTGRLKKAGSHVKIGDVYSTEVNDFIDPQPYASWTLNTETKKWQSPLGDPPTLTDDQTVGVIGTQNGATYVVSGYAWDEDAYQADNTTGWVYYSNN